MAKCEFKVGEKLVYRRTLDSKRYSVKVTEIQPDGAKIRVTYRLSMGINYPENMTRVVNVWVSTYNCEAVA